MLPRLTQGFSYALTGLKLAWAQELNFRIEVVCAAGAVALGALLHISHVAFGVIVLVISCVLAVEVLNTALEELCDKFQPTHDPHIAKIKDLAAAAVLLVSIGAGIVGILIFAPYLW